MKNTNKVIGARLQIKPSGSSATITSKNVYNWELANQIANRKNAARKEGDSKTSVIPAFIE